MGDWRSSLFTVFVGNISHRVSRRALWELFLLYGKVMDVYTPRVHKQSFNRSTFAFIRYKRESEMVKAIDLGNGRLVDGWSISVKKANFGWDERFNKVSKQLGSSKNSKLVISGPTAFRDDRTFKAALMGEGGRPTSADIVPNGYGNPEISRNTVAAEDRVNRSKKVEYDLNIPKDEMDWLRMSAKGILKDGMGCLKVCKSLSGDGFLCNVSPLDSFSVLLTFESKEAMMNAIKDERVLSWFSELLPWEESSMERELFAWVILEEVPLQIWHAKFFESLGNSWGTFVKLDDCTINRSRLDVARMLVRVASSHSIPASTSVFVRGSLHKILVAVEESMGADETETVGRMAKRDLSQSQERSNVMMTSHTATAELECVSNTRYDLPFDELGRVSLLTELELTGGFSRVGKLTGTLTPSMGLENEGRQLIVRPDMDVSQDFNGPESIVGPHHSLPTIGPIIMGSNAVDLSSHGLSTHSESHVSDTWAASLIDSTKAPAGEGGPNHFRTPGKRKKKNKKWVKELVYGDKVSAAEKSDGSIADDDIEHRNSIIRKEAESTWEVSQIMGIAFDCEKNNLLKVFMDLEQAEMERKESLA